MLLDERVDATAMVSVLDTLRGFSRLALDLEADSFHVYFEKICLVQISTPERDLIFDPVTHGMPEALKTVLSEPGRTWVLHGADYDVLSLKRELDLTLGGLFDTMIAARFLGYEALGLQAVLQRELGVEISKSEQRSDWGRRPLSASQLGYARQDTEHLLPLAERLSERLAERGRLSWVVEECELLRHRTPTPKVFDEHGWLKIKGARALPESGQRALKAGYLWRDEVARRTNRAPFRVIGNETLFAIASSVSKDGARALSSLHQRRGVPRGMDLRPLEAAIRRALGETAPIVPRRTPDEKRPPALDPAARQRLDRLRSARQEWSASLGLDPGVLVPTALLEALAREPPEDLTGLAAAPGMTSWRIEALGLPILAVLHGKKSPDPAPQ